VTVCDRVWVIFVKSSVDNLWFQKTTITQIQYINI